MNPVKEIFDRWDKMPPGCAHEFILWLSANRERLLTQIAPPEPVAPKEKRNQNE